MGVIKARAWNCNRYNHKSDFFSFAVKKYLQNSNEFTLIIKEYTFFQHISPNFRLRISFLAWVEPPNFSLITFNFLQYFLSLVHIVSSHIVCTIFTDPNISFALLPLQSHLIKHLFLSTWSHLPDFLAWKPVWQLESLSAYWLLFRWKNNHRWEEDQGTPN